MEYIQLFIYQHPLISFAQMAFMLWMLFDCHRRQIEPFWFWIILLLPVIGAWAYFFWFMAPELAAGRAGNWFAREVSVQELRYRAEQSPTLANQLALGQALIDKHEYTEAQPILEGAHRIEPEHCQVLYALAECALRQGDAPKSKELLDRIIERDPRWSDYQAWRLLLETQTQLKNPEAALANGRELVKLSPTLMHKCLLAEVLIDQSQRAEARGLLEKALDDHSYHPGPIRRRNKPWAKQAKKLLKGIG